MITLKPGEVSTGRTDKQLTAVLLDPETQATLAVGEKARALFADYCDDSKKTYVT